MKSISHIFTVASEQLSKNGQNRSNAGYMSKYSLVLRMLKVLGTMWDMKQGIRNRNTWVSWPELRGV